MLLGRREHSLEASSRMRRSGDTRSQENGRGPRLGTPPSVRGGRPLSVGHTLCLFSSKPTHLADFNQVQTIQYSNSEDKDRKGMLQLKVAGAPEVWTRWPVGAGG